MVDSAVDPDFIGPMLPPDHALRLASPTGEEETADSASEIPPLGLPNDAETLITADLFPAGTEPGVIEGGLDNAAKGPLLQDEALLQREAEVSEFDQPLASAMLARLAPSDHVASAPSAKGMADAATAHASHLAAMMTGGTKPVAARDAAMKAAVATADASMDLIKGEEIVAVTPTDSSALVAPVSASAPDQTDAAKPAHFDTDMLSIDPAMLAFGHAVSPHAAQLSHHAQAPVDADRAAQHNATPVLPPVPPRMIDPAAIAVRDAALLQTMNTFSQPLRNKPDVRNATPLAGTSSFAPGMAPLADVPPQAPSESRAPLSLSNALSDEARRLDLPVDRLPRETASATTQRDGTGTANIARDADLAAMIQGVSISGFAGLDQINPAAPVASVLPVVTGITQENTTRDAPAVAAIAADGRRDTQRDADIRERQIKQQVTAAIRAGSQEVRMQLYPPGLGQIIIRIAMEGGKLRLSMKAGNAEAAETLTQTEAGLRDALARDGFALTGFDVHDDEHQGRNNRDQAGSVPPLTRAAEEGEAFSVDMTA